LPAKDYYHDTVKRALLKDGWTITAEQVKIIVEGRNLFIDMEIAHVSRGLVALIEVKELEEVPSPVEALASALGKYFLYRWALDDAGENTPLFLAVSQATYYGILSEKLGAMSIEHGNVPLLVFDPEREEIVKWLP